MPISFVSECNLKWIESAYRHQADCVSGLYLGAGCLIFSPILCWCDMRSNKLVQTPPFPVEQALRQLGDLKLGEDTYQNARLNGSFSSIRDAGPDFWGRRLIERHSGKAALSEIEIPSLSQHRDLALVCGDSGRLATAKNLL